MKGRICELCSKEASLYCELDTAFLCWTCDAVVHQANFLAARHIRRPLCSNCKGFAGNFISGKGPRHSFPSPICRSCSPNEYSGEDQADSLSSSAVCVSTNESKRLQYVDRPKTVRIGSSSSVTELSGKDSRAPAIFSTGVSSNKTNQSRHRHHQKKKKLNDQNRPRGLEKVDAKAEGIFGNWCKELGLNGNSAVVSLASHALCFYVGRYSGGVMPFRVSLAASFWYGLRSCVDKSSRVFHNLRQLEEVSWVPAKLIVAVGLKIDRELRVRKCRRRDLEEGWAECAG